MMTRRFFAGLVTSLTAAAAVPAGFVRHKVLRRPYNWRSEPIGKPDRLYWHLYLDISARAPVRVKVGYRGEEPLALVTALIHTRPQRMGIQSVRHLKADKPLVIEITSTQPFTVHGIEPKYQLTPETIKRANAQFGTLPDLSHRAFYEQHPELVA